MFPKMMKNVSFLYQLGQECCKERWWQLKIKKIECKPVLKHYNSFSFDKCLQFGVLNFVYI